MHQRALGTDLHVPAIGLGCTSMTAGYCGRPDTAQMVGRLHAAVDRGVTFVDTAEIYGPYADDELVGEALTPPVDLANRHGTATTSQTRPFPRVRS